MLLDPDSQPTVDETHLPEDNNNEIYVRGTQSNSNTVNDNSTGTLVEPADRGDGTTWNAPAADGHYDEIGSDQPTSVRDTGLNPAAIGAFLQSQTPPTDDDVYNRGARFEMYDMFDVGNNSRDAVSKTYYSLFTLANIVADLSRRNQKYVNDFSRRRKKSVADPKRTSATLSGQRHLAEL